ncbi:hypothetical protein [Bergeyella sp. RCAD1439]|uniref:hypothetical protein n=1 Tax=Bergeyella anatis TaxID=3113737 RepID=UPI002A8E5208|nr:hypothetical protein [Riemerella anatipestifer]MEC5393931.1 hypothetical protein [Bergeyella sp. RCAD1439]
MSNLENTTTALSLLELATAEAKKIFENYPELEEVYITSDMQGFKELEKAENQAAYLKNKKVHHFKRKDFRQKIFVSEADIQTEDQAGEETKAEDDERAELMAKYEAKHGKKAPHNIGLGKLRASVED